MGKNQNGDHPGKQSYSVKYKSYSTTSEASRVFPPELSFIDRKTSEVLGTPNVSFCRQPLQCGEGNMKTYSPKSIICPEGIARGEYDTRG
jgi:hypothetical protein